MLTITEGGKTFELRPFELRHLTKATRGTSSAGIASCPYCDEVVGVTVNGPKSCNTVGRCGAKFFGKPLFKDDKRLFARSGKPL